MKGAQRPDVVSRIVSEVESTLLIIAEPTLVDPAVHKTFTYTVCFNTT